MTEDLQLQEHLTVLGHKKAPGVLLLADGGRVVSSPEVVLSMACLIAENTGRPDLADELRAAFAKADGEHTKRKPRKRCR
jgi:hypothetical protein